MSNPTIIEVSRKNSNNPDNNNTSVWNCQMKEAIPIYTGDRISLRSAFINVDESNSTDIVIPPSGQDITLQFHYYEFLTDLTNRTKLTNGPAGPDFQPWIIYQDGADKGDLKSVTLFLSEYVFGFDNASFKFSYQLKDGTTHSAEFPISYHGDVDKDIAFPLPEEIKDVIVGTPKWLNPSDWPFRNGGKQAMTLSSSSGPWNYDNETPLGNKHPKVGSVTVRLEPGHYDMQSMSKHMSDKLQFLDTTKFNGFLRMKSSNEFLIRACDDAALGQTLYGIKIGETDMTKGYQIGTGKKPIWVGASQVSLLYGANANLGDTMCIEYLHTPWINLGQISTRMMADGGNDKYIVPQQTGIFLTDVQPRDFWQKLGFDPANILINMSTGPDPDNIKYVPSIGELYRVIPLQYTGMAELLNNGARDIQDAALGFIASNTTLPILGSLRDLNPQSHYLLEVSFGAGVQSYIFPSGQLSHVFAIVSGQYIQDGIVTGFQDSGIPYMHNSQPFALNNIKVRILDPSTKQPLTILGNNSTIYLQIDRQSENTISVRSK